MSSLAAYIKSLDKPDEQLIKQLNHILRLAHDPNALKLPMEFSSFIWQNFSIDLIRCEGVACDRIKDFKMRGLTRGQSRRIANRFIEKMPKWLVYSSKTKIREDIFRLFLSLEIIDSKV